MEDKMKLLSSKIYIFIFLVPSLLFGLYPTTKSFSTSRVNSLKSITLVEHVILGSYETFDYEIEQAKILYGEENFFVLKLPHRFDEKILSTSDTQLRGDIYCQPIQAIPVLAVDGIVDLRDKKTQTHWPEVIGNGVKNHLNLADFSFQVLPTGQYEIDATGNNDALNQYANVNLNVIFFQDWVPCSWENGDTMVRNLARKFPLGPLGKKVNIKNNKLAMAKFDVSLSSETKNMTGFVAFIQDMDSKRILSSAIYRYADTEKPAYFCWNEWPRITYDYEKNTLIDKYLLKTGLTEMKMNVKNAKDLRLLQFDLNYTEEEKGFFEVIGAKINPEIEKISTFLFEPSTKSIQVYLSEPVNGDMELFSLIIHFKKDNLSTSSSFKIKNFAAYNSKNNLVYFDVNDIKQYYPNMLLVVKNPLDFNNDSWIDSKDLFLLLPQFGLMGIDSNYSEKFDIDQSDGKKRIDLLDIVKMTKEVNNQELLLIKSK